MRRLRTRALLIAAGTLTLVTGLIGVAAGPAGAESNGGVRVMPLGDSITEGTQVPGGYRIGLWQRMTAAGYRVDLVGSQFNGPSGLGDHDHEGHPGWRIDQIDASISGWLRTTTPRTVLLHIGTNDILQNYNVSSAPQRLSTLIDHITTAAPSADVFVATLIPLSSASQENAARTFNAAIPGIVQSKVNAGRRVHLVDMHSALSTGDLIDGVHPTANGYDKMAARWFSALQSVPGSIGDPAGSSPSPSSPSPSAPSQPSPSPSQPSPSPSPSPSQPSGQAGCTAAYAVIGQWPGGFQAEITVSAAGRAITGWTVTWQNPAGHSVTQSWSATVTSAGSTVTASNVDYNGTIPAGGSTRFGLLGSATGAPSVPTAQCTAR
jgi:lysophospholipase L1-like esterase